MPQTLEDAYTPLWKDRKRIFGLPISFTRYEVTNDRFIVHSGLLNSETNELLLYRVMDIKMVRRFWQKMFGVGTIVLYSADRSHELFEIKNIKKPDAVRRFLSTIVEKERHTKGVMGRELYGAAAGSSVGCEHGAYDFADHDGDGIPG